MFYQDFVLKLKHSGYQEWVESLVPSFYGVCVTGAILTLVLGFMFIVVKSHKYKIIDEFIDWAF